MKESQNYTTTIMVTLIRMPIKLIAIIYQSIVIEKKNENNNSKTMLKKFISRNQKGMLMGDL